MTLEEHAEELRTRGYTIVEGVLDAGQIDASRSALEEIFEREKELGLKRDWHNSRFKVSYMLPQKHRIFRGFCLNPRLLPLMRLLLGESCVVASLNGLTMTPGGQTQGLHIDQFESIPNAVLYVNALHTLDDFTRENGCTRVIPFSQNRIWQRKVKHDQYEVETVYLEAPAGSLIAYNGGRWHAGSRNGTDRPRRAIHAYFGRSWCRPQWDYTRSLSPDVISELSEEEKALFGFYATAGYYDYRTDEEMRVRPK